MAKVNVYSVDKKERSKIEGELFEIIADLNSKKEVFYFLIGLFTASETLMIARRIQIAKMILAGDDYETIRKRLKVSFQTINRIEHWLKSDDEKNKLILKKLKKFNKNLSRMKEPKDSLLDKYTHHRIIKRMLS
jgi:TrpR-related protein YerC/YecD